MTKLSAKWIPQFLVSGTFSVEQHVPNASMQSKIGMVTVTNNNKIMLFIEILT